MSLKILVVDDSATTRTYIKRTLGLLGISPDLVLEAPSGDEALTLLENDDIDLVLSDLNMPKIDGPALIARMASMPQLANIPIIIISTEGSRPKIDRLIQSGIVGFLRKPFTPEQLRDIIQERLAVS